MDYVARRHDPVRQFGVGGVQAVVGHRDGHALAEIAALVGLAGGDRVQPPMSPVLRGAPVAAVRRRGGAESRRPERKIDRVRRAGRRRPNVTGPAVTAAAGAAGRQQHGADQREHRRSRAVQIPLLFNRSQHSPPFAQIAVASSRRPGLASRSPMQSSATSRMLRTMAIPARIDAEFWKRMVDAIWQRNVSPKQVAELAMEALHRAE